MKKLFAIGFVALLMVALYSTVPAQANGPTFSAFLACDGPNLQVGWDFDPGGVNGDNGGYQLDVGVMVISGPGAPFDMSYINAVFHGLETILHGPGTWYQIYVFYHYFLTGYTLPEAGTHPDTAGKAPMLEKRAPGFAAPANGKSPSVFFESHTCAGGTAAGNGPCENNIDSGRINDTELDCGAPVAVFENSVDVFGIDPASAAGHLDVQVTDARLAEVGVPEENTLLAEGVNFFTGRPIEVYRLTTGEFQLNTYYADGKPYIITWEAGGFNLKHLAL